MTDQELLKIASKTLVNLCEGEITEDEARKTIIVVLRILERIEKNDE